jgi:uncharacterized membrane protein YoaK (UPF0700 family)
VRTVERDALLILLAIASGAADCWSYFGLGHAFVANMTGNTVLLGFSVFHPGGDLLHPGICLATYAAGVAVATGFTTRRLPQQQKVIWTRAVSWVLLLEALCMSATEILWVASRRSPGSTSNELLGLAAFAIGLQSGAMLVLKVPGIVTTYITGTWTTMMNGVTRLLTGEQIQAGERLKFEERTLLQAGFLSAYLLSAIFTGWLFSRAHYAVGAMPAACLLVVSLYGMYRGGEYSVAD